VVLGGRSAGSRDARMRELIESHIAEASAKPVMVADAGKSNAAKTLLASAESVPAPTPSRSGEATATIAPGSNAPLTPVKVKTVTVRMVATKMATATPSETATAPKPEPIHTAALSPSPQEEALAESLVTAAPIEPAPAPATQPGVLGKLPAMMAAAREAAVPSAKAEPAPPAKAEEHFASAPPRHAAARGGWAIQVGAYEDEREAKQHLSTAKSKMTQVLHKAEAYIERTVKGAKTYYRARFAGFDRNQAESACKRLKREDVACMALKI
jgi:D-alanyl-D-alanine carboxypeptidase